MALQGAVKTQKGRGYKAKAGLGAAYKARLDPPCKVDFPEMHWVTAMSASLSACYTHKAVEEVFDALH